MPITSKKTIRETRKPVRVFSLLSAIITRIKQKALRKRKSVVSGSEYDFGCSPASNAILKEGSENGGYDISQ